jgi:hypothetical protein
MGETGGMGETVRVASIEGENPKPSHTLLRSKAMLSWPPKTSPPRKNARRSAASQAVYPVGFPVGSLRSQVLKGCLSLWALLFASGIVSHAPSLAIAAEPAAAEPVAAEQETRLPVRPTPKPLDPTPTPSSPTPVGHMNLSHEDQIGLALMPGSGYRMIVPYKDLIECGQLGKRVCTGRIPWFLDVEPSFGLSQGWDVLVTLRFGLESDFHTHHQFAVMPGFRYWFDRDTALRLYATLQFVYDQTDQNQSAVSNSDLGFRNSNGFMYDIVRNFSLYFQFGETVGLKRWFRFEMDGGLGLQVRLP